MRPEEFFLKDLHSAPPRFRATKHINRIIDEELRSIRQKSVFDYYHTYVSQNGYPLSKDAISRSSYVSRQDLEGKLTRLIKGKKDIILLGCEGSGKTTLLHKVASDCTTDAISNFLYIDANDIEGIQNVRRKPVVFLKLAKTIAKLANTEFGEGYAKWLNECQQNPFLKPLIRNETPVDQVESFFTFIRTHNHNWITHVVIDNIDSVSVDVCDSIFSNLKAIDETVKATASVLGEKDYNSIRYIISCRTATYKHINGTTRGLFLNRPHELLEVEDDFVRNTNIIEILESFLLNPNGEIYKKSVKITVPIVTRDFTYTTSLSSYFSDVIKWLKSVDSITNGTVNKSVKMFSGRSIRRAKLYGLKIFANPLISRLALFETKQSVNITSRDRLYLKRRLLEAIFDFRKDIGAGLHGFPLNPYYMIEDKTEFKNNPLIGIFSIFHLYENAPDMKVGSVYFANVIDCTTLYHLLVDVGYSTAAITDVFFNLKNSGVLRPVPSSNLLHDSALDDKNIYEEYILDNNALDSIYGLIVGRDIESSIIFYNCALRSRFNLGHSRYIDNWLSECFTTLSFLKGFYQREAQLEKLLEDSNLILSSPSERFAGKILKHCSHVFHDFEKRRYKPADNREAGLNSELYQQTETLLELVKEMARETSSILG